MPDSAPRPLPIVSVSSCATALAEHPGQVRKSNGVAGFSYKRWKGILYVAKVFCSVPLFFLWPFFLAREARDWSIARNYFRTLAYCLRTVFVQLRFGSIHRLVKYNLRYGPEEVKARIARRRGACTRCAKCCKQFDCIFLGHDAESKEYFCKVYQTDYWYYGTCGRYPLDQRDIDDHACPGFSFEESPA